MQIDDLSSTVYAPELHDGVECRSVGWLGRSVPTVGTIAPIAIERLRLLRQLAYHDEGDLGDHDCEICGQYSDRGQLWLEFEGVRYVVPAMIVHYCEEHSYCPPAEFIEALHHCIL